MTAPPALGTPPATEWGLLPMPDHDLRPYGAPIAADASPHRTDDPAGATTMKVRLAALATAIVALALAVATAATPAVELVARASAYRGG